MLRILCVNFGNNEYQRIRDVIIPDGFELLLDKTSFEQILNSSDKTESIDLVLMFDPGVESRVDEAVSTLHYRMPQLPIFVLAEALNESHRISLENLGAERVFSVQLVSELLPDCIRTIIGVDEGATKIKVDPLVDRAMNSGVLDQKPDAQHLITDTSFFLEALLNTVQSIVVVVDFEGRIHFFNKQAEALTGYTLDEVKGRNFADLFLLPEEEEHIIRDFHNRRYDLAPVQHSESLLTRSGTVKKIEWISSIIEDQDHGESYVVGVGLDITNALEKNRDLFESREWYSRIFEYNPTGMAILSYREGRMIETNPRFRSMINLGPDEILGKSLHELGLLQTTDEWESNLLLKIQQRSVLSLERKALSSDGHLMNILLAFDVVELSGTPYILMSVQDLTDRMSGEEQSRKFALELEGNILERSAALEAVNRELKSEIAFRKALETSTERLIQIIWETPDIVSIADLSGQLQYLNRAGRQILGIGETDSITHLSIFGVYTDEFRQFVNTYVRHHVEMHGVWRGETKFHIGNDRVIPVSQVIIGHKDQNGQIQFFSSVARDITDLQHASEELRMAYEKEKELGRLRASFFSMTSHQFRTPLSTILSSSELLEHYGSQWSAEKRRLHTQRIQKSTMRLSQMLNDILEYSKIEARQGNVQVEAINLEELCLRFMNDLSVNDPDQHEFTLDCTIDPCMVYSDRLSLELVIENLFSNAIKYSPRKSQIEVRICQTQAATTLSVRDQGIGILPGEVEMIFEPFHRGSNVVDTPGSGLGLMIVRKSLELIRGEISIQSNVGEGTEITIRIPDLRS